MFRFDLNLNAKQIQYRHALSSLAPCFKSCALVKCDVHHSRPNAYSCNVANHFRFFRSTSASISSSRKIIIQIALCVKFAQIICRNDCLYDLRARGQIRMQQIWTRSFTNRIFQGDKSRMEITFNTFILQSICIKWDRLEWIELAIYGVKP